MKYRIVIEEVTPPADGVYGTYAKVYEQEIEDLNVQAVIRVVNSIA